MTRINASWLARDSIEYIWLSAGLPPQDLEYLHLENTGTPAGTASTFKIGHIAQSSIGLSALAAASFQSARLQEPIRPVHVDQKHALVEFRSDHFLQIDGETVKQPFRKIGGPYAASDGLVFVQDLFPHFLYGTCKLLDIEPDRKAAADAIKNWKKLDFEVASFEAGLCSVVVRSEDEWDSLGQKEYVQDKPIEVTSIGLDTSDDPSDRLAQVPRQIIRLKPLAGVRVVELTRIIAGPLAGKVLAYHGADILWITSPTLPTVSEIDPEFMRGKRSAQLNLNLPSDQEKLLDLLSTADVFLQSYREGALASKGITEERIRKSNPSIITASMSAYGSTGPWAGRRGFDALVQAVGGIQRAEAEAAGQKGGLRPTPCVVLDHGSGNLLAFGIIAALRRRFDTKKGYHVAASLAQTMQWMKDLGRLPAETLQEWDPKSVEDVEEFMDIHESALGEMHFVRHAGIIEGCANKWERFPRPLGSDSLEWLSVDERPQHSAEP